MNRISKAFPLPCEGRNVQAEDAQRLRRPLRLLSSQASRRRKLSVQRHHGKEAVATGARLYRQGLALFLVTAMPRPITAMGKVVIRKGEVRTLPSRHNMLDMTVFFVEQRFTVHAAAFLLAVKLVLEYWPQQFNRRITPVSTGVLSAVTSQRIRFR